MRTPTIHMNGTSPEQLVEQLMEAYRAVGDAMSALDAAAPNGRDYYTQGPDAVEEAMDEHLGRILKLRSVHADLEEMAIRVQDQAAARRARRNPRRAPPR